MPIVEAVEIKVNIAGDIREALKDLELSGGARRSVWFLDYVHPGGALHPLLTAGVILRVRGDGEDGDSTVKLRPCVRSQLAGAWADEYTDGGSVYRVERDWTGTRRVLAASLVTAVSSTEMARATMSGGDPGEVFDPHQAEFLRTCAHVDVDFSQLVALGPIKATRWKTKVDELKVNAERWRVGPLDFLELSIRVEPDQADPEVRQARFHHGVEALHLHVDQNRKAKTETVLDYLAAAAVDRA